MLCQDWAGYLHGIDLIYYGVNSIMLYKLRYYSIYIKKLRSGDFNAWQKCKNSWKSIFANSEVWNQFEFTLFCLRDFKIIVKALKVAFLMKWKVATLIWQGSNIGTKSMQNTSAYEEPRWSSKRLHKYSFDPRSVH